MPEKVPLDYEQPHGAQVPLWRIVTLGAIVGAMAAFVCVVLVYLAIVGR
jgi:hypothetical protein